MIQLKFVDDTGTVEYNQDLNAIQVIFDGSGNFDKHLITVQAAENMSKVYQTQSFLLIKQKFEKISPAEFKSFFSTWLSMLEARPAEKRGRGPFCISLIISGEGFLKLSEIFFEKNLLEYKNVVFNIFTSVNNAYEFLKAEMKKANDFSVLLRQSNQ